MPKLLTESGEFVSTIAFAELWRTLDNMIEFARVRLVAAGLEPDSETVERVRNEGCRMMRDISGVLASDRFVNSVQHAVRFSEFKHGCTRMHGNKEPVDVHTYRMVDGKFVEVKLPPVAFCQYCGDKLDGDRPGCMECKPARTVSGG